MPAGRPDPARRCLVLQHHPSEGPARVAELLIRHGVSVDTRAVAAGDPLPSRLEDTQGLVVMGGPMSAASDDGFPTRRHELELLEAAVAEAVPALGICLGAQLLALSSGGRVFPGTAGPEIGWGEVRLRPAAAHDPVFCDSEEKMAVLHWHGDTFELGAGCLSLASSDRYPAQAFRAGTSAWGLQFHVEVDEVAARGMVAAFPEEAALAEGGADAIVAGAAEAWGDGARQGGASYGHSLLERFAALVART